MTTLSVSWFRKDNDDDEYIVSGTVSPYVPARVSGPPEMCSPAEGGEVEIVSIMLRGAEMYNVADFTDEEYESMSEALAIAAEDYDDYEDPPDPDDDMEGC